MLIASFLFIFGLIIGSFLNVVSFRYSPEKSIFNIQALRGRSHCPNCKTILRWHELVPLFSFLIQQGKCNHCGAKISWQYPLVELTSGLIFLVTGQLSMVNGVLWTLVFLVFLLIFIIDYRHYLIPDELNVSLLILGLGNILFQNFSRQFGEFSGSFLGAHADLFGLRENIWVNHFAAALIGLAVVGLVIIFTRGRGMGMGDLKLMAALGFLYGWPDILLIFMLASLVGGAASAVLMLLKRKGMKDIVPFGPFLVLAAFGLILYPRFILFMTFPLLIILAFGLGQLEIRSIRSIVVYLLLAAYAAYFSFQIIFNPVFAPLPGADRGQFIDDWPAGYGINEIVAFLRQETQNKKVFVATEGTFGLTPYALEIYLQGNPNITIQGFWPINDHPEEIFSKVDQFDEVYILFKDSQNPPERFPDRDIELVSQYRKGKGNIFMKLYRLKR